MWFQHRRFQIVFSVFENLILHIFPIIIIIIPCSGMFRNVPEYSMFLVLSTPLTEGNSKKYTLFADREVHIGKKLCSKSRSGPYTGSKWENPDRWNAWN